MRRSPRFDTFAAPILGVLLAIGVTCPGIASAQRGLGAGLDDPSGSGARPHASEVRGPTNTGRSGARGNAVPEPPPGRYSDLVGPVPTRGPSLVGPDLTLRLRALDSSWQALGAQGGPDYVGAILSMVGGGLEIGLGAILLELGPPADAMAPYFMVLGGVSIVRTIVVDFILRPNPQSTAIEFQHMSSGTRQETLARLHFGEQQLEALANQWLITRIVDASINIAGALAIIPAYLVPRNFTIVDPLEAFIFIGPAIGLIGAIITLASSSSAEQRWDAYRQLRARLAEHGGDDDGEAEAALEDLERPITGGPSIQLGLGSVSGTF